MNKKQFKTRKELSIFLKEKNIDTTNWSEEKWLSLSKSGAEIHIQALAEAMWDARNESEPRKLKAGEWHIPFGDQMDKHELHKLACKYVNKLEEGSNDFMSGTMTTYDYPAIENKMAVKIAIARCARLSYMTFDGEINYNKDIALFEQLFNSKHMSPFEHVARAMSDVEYSQFDKATPRLNPNGSFNPYFVDIEAGWCNNIKGFVQYRFLLEKQ